MVLLARLFVVCCRCRSRFAGTVFPVWYSLLDFLLFVVGEDLPVPGKKGISRNRH